MQVLSGNDASSQSGLQNQSISYFDGSSGYLVYPDTNNETGTSGQEQPQKLPAVVMIHEWWGLNDHIKDMADELAREGYVVLAADLYGEVAADPNCARELSSSVRENPELAISNL
jgi:carboxymethylenebutenolidase